MGVLVSELLAVEERDLDWLTTSLQLAAELELSTIPPYFCGVASIKDQTTPAFTLVRSVFLEEMLHLGLVCNMLTTIGATPELPAPVFPGPLPGGVRPGLSVYLSGLTMDYVTDVYMQIEYPEDGPLTGDSSTPTIGSFYDAIAAAFQELQPTITGQRQLTATINGEPLYAINSLADVQRAIAEIKEQGEGTSLSPDAVDFGGELAHYYRFGEIANGACLVQADGKWTYTGDPVPFPECWPMAPVPAGGWPSPAPDVRALLDTFDTAYGSILTGLRDAWATGSNDTLGDAIDTMFALPKPATALMQVPLPDGSGNYGPDFVVA